MPKPPRASIPKGWEAASVDLERALMLLDLPREIGPHPEDGVVVEAGIGRYGPFVKHGAKYANLPEVDEVFTVPFDHIADPARYRIERRMWRGGWRSYHVAPFGPYYIWGATARVLLSLARRVAG